jgi:precorrin-6B C5,15-methyltransferase / cobalt-precorrin-6B C5,C15-methyltransferase
VGGVTVVGVDGRTPSPVALERLRAATLVVGGRRHLDALDLPPGVRTVVLGDVATGVQAVVDHDGGTVVLASGDPGLFGIVRRLKAAGVEPEVHPGVSSVALAFARAGLRWDDAEVVSAHGRDARTALNTCRAAAKTAVLTAPGAGPREIAEALLGRTDKALFVAERLGEADERTGWSTPEDAAARTDWREPNVVLVTDPCAVEQAEAPMSVRLGRLGTPDGWALPEDAFVHRDGMVTKAEVRAQVLARLAPRPGTLVWDIGAGCGSVGIECARFGAAVVLVERDAEQVARAEQNASLLDVAVEVECGEAPAVLAGLPDPDAVFVGGGGLEVVAAVAARRPRRLVVALAAVERVGPVLAAMAGYETDAVLLSAQRLVPLAGAHRLVPVNPVFVLSGVLP